MKIKTILVILFVTVIIFFIIIYCIFLRDDKDIEEVDEEYNIEELEEVDLEDTDNNEDDIIDEEEDEDDEETEEDEEGEEENIDDEGSTESITPDDSSPAVDDYTDLTDINIEYVLCCLITKNYTDNMLRYCISDNLRERLPDLLNRQPYYTLKGQVDYQLVSLEGNIFTIRYNDVDYRFNVEILDNKVINNIEYIEE